MAALEIKVKFDAELIEAVKNINKRIKKLERELSRLAGRKI